MKPTTVVLHDSLCDRVIYTESGNGAQWLGRNKRCTCGAEKCPLCGGEGVLDFHSAVGQWEPCPNGCGDPPSGGEGG